MKRILALLMMLTLLTCTSAFAEEITLPEDTGEDQTQTEGALPEEDGEAETDEPADDGTAEGDGTTDDGAAEDDGTTEGDGTTDDGAAEDDGTAEDEGEQEPAEMWHPDNTACAFGPQIPGSWQTCAVADLSEDGVQSFDLIAGGGWKIGTVYLTVCGDEVTVDYRMTEDVINTDVWNDVTVDAEYLNIFGDVQSVDRKAESAYAFGAPISISADLGGDTVVAVYVRLTVDFPAHSPFTTRFWPNHPDNAAIVKAMNALLEE